MNCDEKDALLIFLLVLTGVLTAAFAAVLFLFCRRKVRSQNGRCWLLEPKTVSHCMQCCGGSVKATTKVAERGEVVTTVVSQGNHIAEVLYLHFFGMGGG